ncbi:nuclear transport factor 2 family protein, partial [Arthrobacter sp.]
MSRTPNNIVSDWLAGLNAALLERDIGAATALFAQDSYWRDFVAFTWNLKTFEGPEQIGRMLADRLDHVAPGNWALAEDATGDEETTEAWITFETGAANGYGHLRLKDGKCWTLLTTMQELKGFEERK